MKRRVCTRAGAALLLALAGCKVQVGPAPQPAEVMCSSSSSASHVFTSAAQQTEWNVCFADLGYQGLGISGALFRTSAAAPWRTVLWEGRFADVFVPYHNGNPAFRFHDLKFGYLIPLTAADCPAAEGGTLRYAPNPNPAAPPGPRICQEIRPRGVAWRDATGVRRGSELVLWGVYDMGNYKLIMEWSFRDDGVIQGRAGATGFNSPYYPWMGHMHSALWRLDVDLGGSDHDNASVLTHSETPPALTAADSRTLVSTEPAQGIPWDAASFSALEVEDGVIQNGRGHNSGYHLVPIRAGTAQHAEAFTQSGFWVTRYNADNADNCSGVPEISYSLPCYADGQPVADADVVVWYFGSLHHHTRDEDGVADDVDPNDPDDNTFTGATQVMWTGFMLIPHNLFDGPPHWP